MGRPIITGEASPYYLFHPRVPARVATLLPHVKLIALLRNPVDRAYSHYQHEVSLGVEKLSFADAIEHEQERIGGEEHKLLTQDRYYSFNHQHYSYLSRGVYVDQLQRWDPYFPAERLLVIKSEDFYVEPGAAMSRITQFLEIPDWTLEQPSRYNALPYEPMDLGMRSRLQDYFAPHNQRLYNHLGGDFDWDGDRA
jgi:hypothetical protein